jgi:hypothetical protein
MPLFWGVVVTLFGAIQAIALVVLLAFERPLQERLRRLVWKPEHSYAQKQHQIKEW